MKIRNIYFTVLAVGAFTIPLHSALADHDIQMLPPVQFDNHTVCNSSSPQLLAWDGQTSVKCIPNFAADVNGNVGIGTTSPANRLELYHPGSVYTDWYTGFSGAQVGSQGNGLALISTNIMQFYTGGSGWVADGSAPTANGAAPAMFISAAGNVGIGTTTPTYPLDIYSSTGYTNLQLNSPYGSMQLIGGYAANQFAYIEVGNSGFTANGKGLIIAGWDESTLPQLWLEADNTYFTGNVGIGTETPRANLEVAGNALIDTSLAIGRTTLSPSNYLVVGDDGTPVPANAYV